MPDNVWPSILIVVLGSTALATLINILLTPYVKKTEYRWSREGRTEDANLDVLIRQQKAHEEAKAVFVPLATEVFRFIDQICNDILGPDSDYDHPEPSPTNPERQVAANLAKLRQLWSEHPTREVRAMAEKLYDNIASEFGELRPGDYQFPSPEERDRATLLRWRAEARKLIDALHTQKMISKGHLVDE